ncbi:Hedgehog/intein hint domain protein [Desulforamulus reducens MI-1]|uniref:Hedgehog/intein hint domain protein n=1 Tax=Desulforamulus reducens (strain ATCC BAA-1160 / DSM 100696 / MI-1) TaxID=349161 RepID=A4J382_DESRM|nr:Hint domain-containing protein [Desulforamulus reducens]ABO49535.1 Hedgehog/intein hint domain protein [Desulforamulus reducens MI-1]
MGWENCVANIRTTLDRNAKEVNEVNWSAIDQDALDNDTFRNGSPFSLICPSRHCTDFADISPQAHRICRCEDMNGNPIPNCEPKDYLYPYPSQVCLNIDNPSDYSGKRSRACTRQGDSYYQLTCHCCCSCFAYGTKIGTPNGHKKIEKFAVGDLVLAAGIETSAGGIKLNWSPLKVSFSSGTGPDSHQPAMVYIRHGDTGSIIVTPDHLFLMPNGKLKRADRLVPGKDQLVSYEGRPVPVHEVSIGEYEGGVHHIATQKNFTGDLDGHLLLSEGVVSGDFNLQIHATELKEKYFIVDHDSYPQIGTKEYIEQNNELVQGSYLNFQVAGLNESNTAPQPLKYFVHGQKVSYIPETAAKYLSSLQEIDVNDNAEKRSFSEMNMGNAAVNYVLKLFRGFYSNIIFHHDIARLEPNAYAFNQYGKDIVVLSGGLSRIKNLQMEGLAVILSHMVTRLQKSDPLDYNGYTSVAMADYYSPSVLQTVLFDKLYADVLKEGVKQIEDNIFSNIDKKHAAFEEDPYTPTWETRLDSLDAGYAMDFPPEEIGGPVFQGLKLQGAEAFSAVLTQDSFIAGDIDSAVSRQVFEMLKKNKVLDEQGVLSSKFSIDTDLDFLFKEKPKNLKRYLTEGVRYMLMHEHAKIRLTFNLPMSAARVSAVSNYELEPETSIFHAEVDEKDASVLWLAAPLQRDKEYTLTVSNYFTSQDGSTLDPKYNSIKVKLS